jgi:microcystin-dependent protein
MTMPRSSDVSEVVADIAETIRPEKPQGEVAVRVGVVSAVEGSSPYRVRLDITGTTWLSRTSDASIEVGDKVWAVQQGEVVIVAGRLNSVDSLVPVGSVTTYAGSTAPDGWLEADGSAVSRTTYARLYAVCGTTYGPGDGSTTFNLPNLRNNVVVGSGGSYARGGTGGAATVTLTTSQIPAHDHGESASHTHTGSGTATSAGSHSHTYTDSSTTRTDLLAGGGTTANNGSASASTGTDGAHTHPVTLSINSGGAHTHSSVGSGGSHENMPPYVAMMMIIRAV